MPGITSVLNIARGALIVNQRGISVTGHNIANVNTPGYTRQRLILEANTVPTNDRLKLGMGVQADQVVQYFDQFTTRIINQRTSSLSEFESKKSILDYLQGIFNDAKGAGLTETLGEFWNAWQSLSDNPGGIPERTALLQKAQSLCQRFQTLQDNLIQAKEEMKVNLGVSLNELNTLTEQVARLNGTIVASESSGTRANDLRDQRNNLIEKISQLTEINYLEAENGSITIMTKSGIALVDRNQSWKLKQEGDLITWNNLPHDFSNQLSGGKIGAWLDLRDATIPQYMANLDELAGTLIHEVNTLHFAGYTLAGETGKYFFENLKDPPETPNAEDFRGAAAYIRLSSDVEGIPANIAASGEPSVPGGEPGNNENALAIQALQSKQVDIKKWVYRRGENPSSQDQSGTMDEYYSILVGDIGVLVEDTSRNQSFNETMVAQLNEVRDSMSGVNLDEEMMDLMKYQQAYSVASKLVTVSDEMLQDLLRMR